MFANVRDEADLDAAIYALILAARAGRDDCGQPLDDEYLSMGEVLAIQAVRDAISRAVRCGWGPVIGR